MQRRAHLRELIEAVVAEAGFAGGTACIIGGRRNRACETIPQYLVKFSAGLVGRRIARGQHSGAPIKPMSFPLGNASREGGPSIQPQQRPPQNRKNKTRINPRRVSPAARRRRIAWKQSLKTPRAAAPEHVKKSPKPKTPRAVSPEAACVSDHSRGQALPPANPLSPNDNNPQTIVIPESPSSGED